MDNRSGSPGLSQVPAGTPTHTPGGKAFIGGMSPEFRGASKKPDKSPMTAEPEPEAKVSEKDGPCPACELPVKAEHIFCPTCGIELGRSGVGKALGVEFSDEDISEYLFKGYMVKDIPIFKGKMATMKTLLPRESNAAEDTIMAHFKGKDATNGQWANVNALVHLSHAWVKFDGQSLGETPEARYERLESSIGVHLIDIASKKWSLFNKAVIALLEDPNVIKNS